MNYFKNVKYSNFIYISHINVRTYYGIEYLDLTNYTVCAGCICTYVGVYTRVIAHTDHTQPIS